MRPKNLRLSRRYFIEYLGLASAVSIISPSILMAQPSKKTLSIAIIGEDLTFSTFLQKSNEVTFLSSYKSADVIYVSKVNENIQNIIQKALIAGKHLIIEHNKNSESMIEKCQAAGVLLAIVKRSENDVKLFKSVNYYESNLSQSFDIQKIILKLNFLATNTEKDKFKIYSIKS